jgi:hypothetical protein
MTSVPEEGSSTVPRLSRREAVTGVFGLAVGASAFGIPPTVPRGLGEGSTYDTDKGQRFPSTFPSLNLADWVDTTGARDATAGIRAALESLRGGGLVTGPAGAVYACSEEIVIPHDGIGFDFQGSHPSPLPWPTLFDFSRLGSGKNCFSARGKRGLSFRNFNLQATNGIGGAGIQVLDSSKLEVNGLVLTLRRGSSAFGIQLGDTISADNAVIASGITNCVVSAQGVPFFVGAGCTSVGLTHSFAIGASGRAAFHFYRSTYCGAHFCACDSGTGDAYGYGFTGAVSIGIRCCGAEGNAKGFALITDSHGISLDTCRGVGNNTTADREIGSFAEIAGRGSYNIKIDTCEDTNPHPRSKGSIRASPGTGRTTIIGFNDQSFPLGYTAGSDAEWIAGQLSII